MRRFIVFLLSLGDRSLRRREESSTDGKIAGIIGNISGKNRERLRSAVFVLRLEMIHEVHDIQRVIAGNIIGCRSKSFLVQIAPPAKV